MSQEYAYQLPKHLEWKPVPIYDPVPEWWIQNLTDQVQLEVIALRMDTMQQILRVQADGLGKAAEFIRSQRG